MDTASDMEALRHRVEKVAHQSEWSREAALSDALQHSIKWTLFLACSCADLHLLGILYAAGFARGCFLPHDRYIRDYYNTVFDSNQSTLSEAHLALGEETQELSPRLRRNHALLTKASHLTLFGACFGTYWFNRRVCNARLTLALSAVGLSGIAVNAYSYTYNYEREEFLHQDAVLLLKKLRE